MCRNPKVWMGLALAAVAVAFFAPGAGAIVALLLLAACPLMMLVMMGGVAGVARRGRDDPEPEGEVTRLRAEVAELREQTRR